MTAQPPTPAIILPPYARGLGMEIDHIADGVPVLGCDYGVRVIGRPGFWHGGALSGLLEMAAITAVQAHPFAQGRRIKPINVAVQFMRGGIEQRTYAVGRIVRAGRRLVNVTAEAWQEDRSRLLAMAQINVLLADREDQ